jgi:hypothetical protein
MRIELDEPEWRQVLAVLAQAPWQVANPLIMKIGAQMQAQPDERAAAAKRGNGVDEGVATERG